ncbi:DNA/RNA helicase [Companilactobacillus sp. RD055328]|nr:DNA/RNA helicase [Companilactobacillus sp. RD055328]
MQDKVSQELKDNYLKFSKHLLWAVTGAGKTEILFSTLNDALEKGFRVAIVSPRVDVCEELFPRFQAAFNLDISLMHGKKDDDLHWTQLVIATVHQMIKFRSAFDLIIVDEVDSYPLFGNYWLQDILFRALKKDKRVIYLSATPPKKILQNVDKIYYLPQRFHGKPLPVPKPKIILGQSILPQKILRHIRRLIRDKQRFIMFFPSIEILEKFGEGLEKYNLDFSYKLVSSKNNERLDIIRKFRVEKLFALFSTTILERGVTFNDIDVLVYQSNHPNFSKEVLIQIAGRAGRQREHFDNEVTFYYREYNQQIKFSINEIKKMNRLAEKLI